MPLTLAIPHRLMSWVSHPEPDTDRLAAVSLALALFLVPPHAIAHSSKPSTALGTTSCSSLEERSKPDLVYESAIWTEGFLSAQHPEIPEWESMISEKFSRAQKEAFIISFCREFKEATIRDAASSLVHVLEQGIVYRPREL